MSILFSDFDILKFISEDLQQDDIFGQQFLGGEEQELHNQSDMIATTISTTPIVKQEPDPPPTQVVSASNTQSADLSRPLTSQNQNAISLRSLLEFQDTTAAATQEGALSVGTIGGIVLDSELDPSLANLPSFTSQLTASKPTQISPSITDTTQLNAELLRAAAQIQKAREQKQLQQLLLKLKQQQQEKERQQKVQQLIKELTQSNSVTSGTIDQNQLQMLLSQQPVSTVNSSAVSPQVSVTSSPVQQVTPVQVRVVNSQSQPAQVSAAPAAAAASIQNVGQLGLTDLQQVGLSVLLIVFCIIILLVADYLTRLIAVLLKYLFLCCFCLQLLEISMDYGLNGFCLQLLKIIMDLMETLCCISEQCSMKWHGI